MFHIKIDPFDLEKTANSGQIFRWRKIKENMYKNKYNYINGVEEKIYLKKNI